MAEKKGGGVNYLARIGDDFVITPSDFYRNLEIEKMSCIKNIENKKTEFEAVKVRLFNKMIEEIIILKKATLLNINISQKELTNALDGIMHDYPGKEFEKSLLKNAVTFAQWEKKLKNRLIIDKVIKQELKNKIIVKASELSEYYQKFFASDISKSNDSIKGEKDEITNKKLIEQLRSKKAEDAYGQWIENLWHKSDVKINSMAWEKILKT